MSDTYKLDSHKLLYHIKEINDWMDGKLNHPIYVEISPVNHCNHRCNFCSFNFTGYKEKSLDTNTLINSLVEMSRLGVKSIMYAGEGEPLLHEDIRDIINHTKRNNIDVSLTTNGVLLSENMWRYIGDSLSWIKVSIDAFNPMTYAKLHGTKESDIEKVFKNLEYAVKFRERYDWECTIGTQSILFPENIEEMVPLANKLKEIGVDYFVIKPFTGHQYRKGYNTVDYPELDDMFKDDDFVIFRADTFNELDDERSYTKCNALPFWSYIDSNGDVYSCSNFLGNKDYVYGNIYKSKLKDIWKNESVKIDISKCRKICRMDKINQYLWELKHPPKHVNFI